MSRVTDRTTHAHPGAAGVQRRPPWGVVVFLAYAFLILAGVALTLPTVIDMAIDTPVSFIGVVVMALLAYTIFTITLFLQRKAAARTLGLGLASLTVPPIAIALLSGLPIPALFLAALAALLFRGLTRPATGRWLDEV
jgi:hypothetical protein